MRERINSIMGVGKEGSNHKVGIVKAEDWFIDLSINLPMLLNKEVYVIGEWHEYPDGSGRTNPEGMVTHGIVLNMDDAELLLEEVSERVFVPEKKRSGQKRVPVKWLVTVQVESNVGGASDYIKTVEIELNQHKTPVDWFKTKPKVENFPKANKVTALIGFWKIG